MTPERWLVISVRMPEQGLAAELADGLIALGGTAVEEARGLLTTYVPAPEDPPVFLEFAEASLAALLPDHELDLVWRWEADQDWTRRWCEGLEARRVGRRMIVVPSWVAARGGPSDLLLEIDPAMAFGTGEHATTRASLRLLEEAVHSGDRVLDVGTGSGILAIAAAKLGAAQVLAVDNDEDALLSAGENVERNRVQDRVELRHAVVDDAFLAGCGPASFDVVAANVLTGVLQPLLDQFRRVLEEGGRLVLAGVLEEEAEGLLEAAERAGLRLVVEDLEEEWWAGLFREDRPRLRAR